MSRDEKVRIWTRLGFARVSRYNRAITTGTKRQVDQHSDYLETLDSYKALDGELLPVFTDRWFSTARDIADAVSEVAPDAAQDARCWLLSAIQRDLITRRSDGRFELSDTGRTALKQPA